MKSRLKRFAIAATVVVLAVAALFFGLQRWRYPPRTFGEVLLPLVLEDVDRCSFQIFPSGYIESGTPDPPPIELTSEQYSALLELLSSTTYRETDLSSWSTTLPSQPDILFHAGSKVMGLGFFGRQIHATTRGMLSGDAKLYTCHGGEKFQQDVLNFLENCANSEQK